MPDVPPKVFARIDEEPPRDAADVRANVTPGEALQAQTLRLSRADQALVADLLAHPPRPNQAMEDAFAAHRALIAPAR